jgi:chaperone LolA
MKKIISLFLFFSLIQSVFSQDVEDIIEEVQDKYEKLSDIQASFKQVENFKLTGSVNETVGNIYIKDGSMYKFTNDDQTIVTDGETVWTFNAISKQLIIDKVRKNSGAFLPRDMLFKYPKEYYSTLLNQEKWNDKKVYVIKLDPRDSVYGYVKSMKIWVEDKQWLIHKVETTDLNDNVSIFEIFNIKLNQKLKNSFFNFAPTEGMNVVDMR